MKYALIGCGRIAPWHINAALDNDLQIVALCDVDEEKMKSVAKEFSLENVKFYTDYKKLALECSPELVSVATESVSHAEISLFFIERKINVIIEKPMAMSMKDARKIVAAAEKYGVKVSACHQNRFNTAVLKTKDAIDKGRFGKLSHGSVCVRWSRDKQYYDQSAWRGTFEKDGGALMNQCIHGIDLLRWLFGSDIEEVYGATKRQFHDYIEAEDVGVATVRFKNGAVATVEGTTNCFNRDLEESIFVFGSDGMVKLSGLSANEIEMWEFKDGADDNKGFAEKCKNIYGNGHTSLFADVIDAVENDRQPFVTAKDGLLALELVLAIYKSSHIGKSVKLPLKNFSTLDMLNEFDK